MQTTEKVCPWAGNDPLYRSYHDTEWGVPLHDDRRLFELLVLEGMQAGLSWLTILRKRDNFRAAFDQFDPTAVALYDEDRISQLLQNPGIIRNRLKIKAAVANARAFLQVQAEFGSFDRYLWSFVGHQPIVNHWQTLAEIPAKTVLSDRLSRDMQSRGFRFAGSTICYALMQSAGLVWDHLADCSCQPQKGTDA
ncbi:MAG TPA: DNA-3-methyladenine glycosylase I [Clostridiales bacterium]|nr:DNA-3-methyladenine glycosylase I [Clostridiales bacterium]